jgi:hypothetical protein
MCNKLTINLFRGKTSSPGKKRALLLPPDAFYLTFRTRYCDVKLKFDQIAAQLVSCDYLVSVKYRNQDQFSLFPPPKKTTSLGCKPLGRRALKRFSIVCGDINSLSYSAFNNGVRFENAYYCNDHFNTEFYDLEKLNYFLHYLERY